MIIQVRCKKCFRKVTVRECNFGKVNFRNYTCRECLE